MEWVNLTQITIISTTVGKNSFEEVNEIVQNAVLGFSLKNDRMISSFPRQTIQYHSNPNLPQPVMLKKLKLNGSMKTYKTF